MVDPTQDQHTPEGARPGGPRAHEGADRGRPWERAWQVALYGARGFYRQQAPAEHFATSAQGLPGGGEVLAHAVLTLARRHGCRRIVDVGAGRGELLAQVRALAPDLHLTGVDVVEAPAGLDVQDWLVSPGGAGLPDALTGLEDALVVAHEWLDVVPCPVVERDGQDPATWRSVLVTAAGQEQGGPVLAGEDLDWARRWLGPEVGRAEIGRPRDRAFAELLSRVTSGLVAVVDYGHTADDRPRHGTLTGFRGGRQVAPVPDGSCDLTAHVAFDSLARVAGEHHLTTQALLLPQLVGQPAGPVPHHLAVSDPAAYLSAVARRAALTALTAPGGPGDFRWLLTPRRHCPA